MRELQAQIIAELGVAPRIDPETEAARRVDFLCDYLRATHTRGFVLGISGGVDSTLAGRLAQLAVEKLREDEIPWDRIAFRSIAISLRHFFEDRRSGRWQLHTASLAPPPPEWR